MNVETVLLIVLSVGFAILLILGIMMAFVLLKIVTNIRRITQRLDETSENLGEVTKYVGRNVAPAAMSALMRVMFRSAKSKVKREKNDKT